MGMTPKNNATKKKKGTGIFSAERFMRFRKHFAWALLISFLLLLLSIGIIMLRPTPTAPARSAERAPEPSRIPLIMTIVSLASSIMSMVGFVCSTIVSLKKDHREEIQSALDLQLKEMELERLRREVEKNRNGKLKKR